MGQERKWWKGREEKQAEGKRKIGVEDEGGGICERGRRGKGHERDQPERIG